MLQAITFGFLIFIYAVASQSVSCVTSSDCPSGDQCACRNTACGLNGTCMSSTVMVMCPALSCASPLEGVDTVSCMADSDCPSGTVCTCANLNCGINGTCKSSTVACPMFDCASPLPSQLPTVQSCATTSDCPQGTVCACANSACRMNGTCQDSTAAVMCPQIACAIPSPDDGGVTTPPIIINYVKPGTCPASTTTNICTATQNTCTTDSNCPNSQKCCDSGCGLTCQDPEKKTCTCDSTQLSTITANAQSNLAQTGFTCQQWSSPVCTVTLPTSTLFTAPVATSAGSSGGASASSASANSASASPAVVYSGPVCQYTVTCNQVAPANPSVDCSNTANCGAQPEALDACPTTTQYSCVPYVISTVQTASASASASNGESASDSTTETTSSNLISGSCHWVSYCPASTVPCTQSECVSVASSSLATSSAAQVEAAASACPNPVSSCARVGGFCTPTYQCGQTVPPTKSCVESQCGTYCYDPTDSTQTATAAADTTCDNSFSTLCQQSQKVCGVSTDANGNSICAFQTVSTTDCSQPLDPKDPVPLPLPICHSYDACGCPYGDCVYLSKTVDSSTTIGFCIESSFAASRITSLGGSTTMLTTRPGAPICAAATTATSSQTNSASPSDVSLSSEGFNYVISSLTSSDDVLKKYHLDVKACSAVVSNDATSGLAVKCLFSIGTTSGATTLTSDQCQELCQKFEMVAALATGNAQTFPCMSIAPASGKKRQTGSSEYLFSAQVQSGQTYSPSSALPTWAIAVIVVGGVAVLVAIIVIVVVMMKKREAESF